MSRTNNGCPFCGCNATQVLGAPHSTHGKGYQVECLNCGARGPCGMRSEKDALFVWENGDNGYTRPKVPEAPRE